MTNPSIYQRILDTQEGQGKSLAEHMCMLIRIEEKTKYTADKIEKIGEQVQTNTANILNHEKHHTSRNKLNGKLNLLVKIAIIVFASGAGGTGVWAIVEKLLSGG